MLQPWLRRSSGVAARSFICPRCRVRLSSAHNHLLSIRNLRTSVTDPPDHIPLRQRLKKEAKSLKAHKKQTKENEEASRRKWELTVGIEIHAQLDTESKLFSSSYIAALFSEIIRLSLIVGQERRLQRVIYRTPMWPSLTWHSQEVNRFVSWNNTSGVMRYIERSLDISSRDITTRSARCNCPEL